MPLIPLVFLAFTLEALKHHVASEAGNILEEPKFEHFLHRLFLQLFSASCHVIQSSVVLLAQSLGVFKPTFFIVAPIDADEIWQEVFVTTGELLQVAISFPMLDSNMVIVIPTMDRWEFHAVRHEW